MSCHICTFADSRLPILCPTCARNRLYQLRLETTQIILEREALGRQIERIVSHDNSQSQKPVCEARHVDTEHEYSRQRALQTVSSQQTTSLHRNNNIAQRINYLKAEIKAQKAVISGHRDVLVRRRSDAESAKYQRGEREAAILTGIQNTTKKTEHLWHSLHSKTAEARIFLCREAANLYGLRQKSAKKGATPGQISTSLSNIAHLLVLVSHYLSLKLPAEITLPHRNHPTPTIYAPAASYNRREVPDEADASLHPTFSPTSSRTADPRIQPRPRPLFIDKPLPRLAKEDPGTYALFLEGATLLAWNVAWLCRTQGIDLTSDSWDEVCDIGKSMWQLLVAPPAQSSNLLRAFAGRDTQAKIRTTKDSPQTTIQRTKSFPVLGHYSHGTVHSFLGALEGSEFMRTWKLPTPARIVDKLKANLLGEMASAEWEILEDNEWDDEPTDHGPGAVQSSKGSKWRPSQSESTDARNHDEILAQGLDDLRRPRGTSGWTKLNSR
ncbi:uncharacterized protein N7459_006760 [Penicillium hispanicum]|uniref:uncharacterized protein n=1 Tax=Penicillium hispanicum TaxID=1080232 RepID=UPI00254187B5|nr:uncharacterized protein N7459_006760 [Penicillium hispanicum]KAJ5577796.1 hypothetical protein N7459_006760 [Penicillium hispanicum]